MDGFIPGIDSSQTDDGGGPVTVDYGGSVWKRLREDPRHQAFIQTGLNLSQVLSVIYEVSHGINYFESRHLVKCGADGTNQVRRSFETLCKLGNYDDLHRYVRADAYISESLPTGDSGGKNQRTYDPDGSLKAMRDAGWFDKGARGENWGAALMPCVNVDTGLSEPKRLKVFDYTASGIPTFKHAFKSRGKYSSRKKCRVCYKSIKSAFEKQSAFFSRGASAEDHAEELAARSLPRRMFTLGVGYRSDDSSQAPFDVPFWVKCFTVRFKSVQDLYFQIKTNIPEREDRVDFWTSLAALMHFFQLNPVDLDQRVLFHVYSFQDFIHSVQAGRFNNLVNLARLSEKKNAQIYCNQTLYERLKTLMQMGVDSDNGGEKIWYTTFCLRRSELNERFMRLGRGVDWIVSFREIDFNTDEVFKGIKASLANETSQVDFLGKLHDFLSFASRMENVVSVQSMSDRPMREQRGEIPVITLKDFVQAVLAGNFTGVMQSLYMYGTAAFLFSAGGGADFDLLYAVIYHNMEKIMFRFGLEISQRNSFVAPRWFETFVPYSTAAMNGVEIRREGRRFRGTAFFTYDALARFGDTGDLKIKLGELLKILDVMKSRMTIKQIIIPPIDELADFFNAVIDKRYEDLASQILNCCRYFYFCKLENFTDKIKHCIAVIVEHETPVERPTASHQWHTVTRDEIPAWIAAFNQIINVQEVFTELTTIIPSQDGKDLLKSRLNNLRDTVGEIQHSGVIPPSTRMPEPMIDTFKDFVEAVMAERFTDLAGQIFNSAHSFSDYSVSAVIDNITLLIKKIRTMQYHVSTIHSADPSVSWVSAFNQIWTQAEMAKIYEVYVEGVLQDPSNLLNFVQNIGIFIGKLQVVKYGPNFDPSKYRSMKIQLKGLGFFVDEVVNGRERVITNQVLKCVTSSGSEQENGASSHLCHTFEFGLILQNLKDFHVLSLEKTNKIYYLRSNFTTPVWVIDFTNQSSTDEDEVATTFALLEKYISQTAGFSTVQFLNRLDALVHAMPHFQFKGIFIKTPLTLINDVFDCLWIGSDEATAALFSTAYYNPGGDGGQFDRFKTRFSMFNAVCRQKMIDNAHSGRGGAKNTEGSTKLVRTTPKTKQETPEWITILLGEHRVSEILSIFDYYKYEVTDARFDVWKSLNYLHHALDLDLGQSDEEKGTPITGLYVFILALFGRRIKDLISCVITYVDRKDLDFFGSHLMDVILEIRDDAYSKGVEYGLLFNEWRDQEVKLRPGGNATNTETDYMDKWFKYKPDDFLDRVPDDSATVKDFRWVFDIPRYSASEICEFILKMKELTNDQKSLFFTKLASLIRVLRSPRPPPLDDSNHAPIYDWIVFVKEVLTDGVDFNRVRKILVLCDNKRIGRTTFTLKKGIETLAEVCTEGMDKMRFRTAVQTEYEKKVEKFNETNALSTYVTHSYQTQLIWVSDSSQVAEFAVKRPAGRVKDSLFECIWDSMKLIINSGVQPYLLFFEPFGGDFLDDTKWCNEQREKLTKDLLKSEVEYRSRSLERNILKKDLVKNTYFAGKEDKYVQDAIESFSNPKNVSKIVVDEIMQLISDAYNITINVTYPGMTKEVEKNSKRREYRFQHALLTNHDPSKVQTVKSARVDLPAICPKWIETLCDSQNEEVVLAALSSQVLDTEMSGFQKAVQGISDQVKKGLSEPPTTPSDTIREFDTFDEWVNGVQMGENASIVAKIFNYPPEVVKAIDEGLSDVIKLIDKQLNRELVLGGGESQSEAPPPPELLSASKMFTPSATKLKWEAQEKFAQRISKFKVTINLKYSGIPNHGDQNHIGYSTLIPAKMTEIFAVNRMEKVIQKNVVDMLIKFQKQCIFSDMDFSLYQSVGYRVRSDDEIDTDGFKKPYDFFTFPVSDELLSSFAPDNTPLERRSSAGWEVIKTFLNNFPTVTHVETQNGETLNEIYLNLNSYNFDKLICQDKTGERGYSVVGDYAYGDMERLWKIELCKLKDEMSGGSIFDSVQLTKTDNRNLPAFAIDLVFESVHLDAQPNLRNEAKYYLSCIWVSLLSYLFHPAVKKVTDLDLSQEQYFFLQSLIGGVNGFDSFCSFVVDLCKKKEAELTAEIEQRQWDEESKNERNERLDYRSSCQEVVKLLDGTGSVGGGAIDLGAGHKRVISTVLNLHIIESELSDDLKVSPDRSHFVIQKRGHYYGGDSFHINPKVFPIPRIDQDSCRFMVRRDFSPSLVDPNTYGVRVEIDELVYLQELGWKCGASSSFFSCIAETCYVIDKAESGVKEKQLMYMDGVTPSESHALRDFVSVLNRMFEWYQKGCTQERRYSSMPAGQHVLPLQMDESLMKIKVMLNRIIEAQWKSFAYMIPRLSTDQLPSFDGFITTLIWENFLLYASSELYVPSLFEMQIMADYLGISILVLETSGQATMQIKLDAVGQKTVSFAMISSKGWDKVLLLSEDKMDKSFRIMSPLPTETKKEYPFSQPFVLPSEPENVRLRRVTSVRDEGLYSEGGGCMMLYDTRPFVTDTSYFYEKLADFIAADEIRVSNIFYYNTVIHHGAWVRLVSMYIHVVTQAVTNLFITPGIEGNSGVQVHEILGRLQTDIENSMQEDGQLAKKDITPTLRAFNDRVVRELGTLIHGHEDMFRKELDNVFEYPAYKANYHEILAMEDLRNGDMTKANDFWADKKRFTFDTLKNMVQNWLSNLAMPVRKRILEHHFKNEIWQFGEDPKHDAEQKKKHSDDLWKTYVGAAFLTKIPSSYELEFLAKNLKIRLIGFLNSWQLPTRKMVKFMGRQELAYDVGINSPDPLVMLVHNTEQFSFMLFKKEIKTRDHSNENGDDMSTYAKVLNDAYTKERNHVKMLADGKFKKKPLDDFFYKIAGIDPLASHNFILSNDGKTQFNRCYTMFAEDKQSTDFKPLLGPNGPQSSQEIEILQEKVKKKVNIEKFTQMIQMVWETITKPELRYIYHAHDVFLPHNLRTEKFKPKFHVSSQGLGTDIEKWMFEKRASSDDLANESNYYQNFVKRIPVFIQLKGFAQTVEKFGMKSAEESQYEYGGELSLPLRNSAVRQFKARFDVKRHVPTGGGDESSSNIYAVLIPVKRSFSHVVCNASQYKVYMTKHEAPRTDLNMSRVSIASIVSPDSVPDMRTQLPSNKLDFEALKAWSSDWCGLKMCIQTAFFFFKNNSKFRHLTMTHIGDTSDLFRFDWIDTFYGTEQLTDFSLFKEIEVDGDSGKKRCVDFKGITNPYHVNFNTLKEIIGILISTNTQMRLQGDHAQKITEILETASVRLGPNGVWCSDQKISDYFNKIDINEADRTVSDLRRFKQGKSRFLMKLLGIAFNVDFVIIESFPLNDINSLRLAENNFYYYTVKESGQDIRINHLKNTFVRNRGLFWCNVPVLASDLEGQNLKSLQGVASSPLKTCPLPVFVVWDNDRWNLLEWTALYNTSITEEMNVKRYNERQKKILEEKKKKEGVYGKDWKGPVAPPTGPAPGNPTDFFDPTNDRAFGYFGANACDHAWSDDGSSSGYDSPTPPPSSDSDDSDEFPNNFFEGRGYRRFDSDDEGGQDSGGGRHGRRSGGMRPLWGSNMPRQAGGPSIYGGADRRSAPPVPTFRGWGVRTDAQFPPNGRLGCCENPRETAVPRSASAPKRVSYSEDQKEMHFMTQKIPMAVNILRYLHPYGCCDLKLQIGQLEQTKMLAVIFACCFDKAMIVPIKGCFTTRMMVACKGLRKDIVKVARVRQMLKGCFDMRGESFRQALDTLYRSRTVPAKRIGELIRQAEDASDELWAEDFRCSLVLARTYIQATLEGRVSPAPEYLSPELADMMNRRVFDRVTPEQRRMNQEMIRVLMKSDIGGQLLPLFRVVFHPDLHTWRLTLPENYAKAVDGGPSAGRGPEQTDAQSVRRTQRPCEYWGWD